MVNSSAPLGPRDCSDIMNTYNVTISGAYYIYPNASSGAVRILVWCDMDTDGGGWTVSIKMSKSCSIFSDIFSVQTNIMDFFK